MTGSGQYSMLILVLTCIISISSAADHFFQPTYNKGVAAAPAPEEPDHGSPVTTFIDVVTPVQPVEIEVNELVENQTYAISTNTIEVDAEFQWPVEGNGRYRCLARRDDFYLADFDCYEPSRDNGKTTVYWLMNDAGLHLSYDKYKWKFIVAWRYQE